jgi:hypothetical protein
LTALRGLTAKFLTFLVSPTISWLIMLTHGTFLHPILCSKKK